MTSDIDLREILRHAAADDPDVYREEIAEAAYRIEELAARLAEVERERDAIRADYLELTELYASLDNRLIEAERLLRRTIDEMPYIAQDDFVAEIEHWLAVNESEDRPNGLQGRPTDPTPDSHAREPAK